jgi:hypothetical protein
MKRKEVKKGVKETGERKEIKERKEKERRERGEIGKKPRMPVTAEEKVKLKMKREKEKEEVVGKKKSGKKTQIANNIFSTYRCKRIHCPGRKWSPQ